MIDAIFSGTESQDAGRASSRPGTDATLSYWVTTPDGEGKPLVGPEGHARLRTVFTPGAVLGGRYVLERELGKGGMGMVFLGRDERLGRAVAIKVMLLHGQEDRGDAAARLRRSFAEEARLGANLLHPAIATVFDYGFHEGEPFTVFEYLPGATLRDLLNRRGRLPLEEVRLIIGPLAQALDFAHAHGVVHRDLKPENIRATDQGALKVLDLGLAKEFLKDVDWSGFAGTPAYASPEQAAGLPCDGRTDQYALALIAYEMLVMRRVFEGRDWRDLLEKHRDQEPTWPDEARPDIPAAVREAVMRALRKDPNRRFATCEQFAVAMGCRFLSQTPPLPEILLDTFISKAEGQWDKPGRSVTLHRMCVHLMLTRDSLWGSFRSELVQWPVRAIRSLRSESGGKVLRLKLACPDGEAIQSFRFADADECLRWSGQIRALMREPGPSRSGVPTLVEQQSIVLTKRRPAARFQIIGPVESKNKRRWRGEDSLRIIGIAAGADAVVDIQEERLPGFGYSEWRLSGTAVRVVDRSGRAELSPRRFSNAVLKLFGKLILFIPLFILLNTRSWLFLPPKGGSIPTRLAEAYSAIALPLNVVHYCWLLALASLLLLRWPQLLKPVVVSFLLLTSVPLMRPLGAIAAGASTGRWQAAGHYIRQAIIPEGIHRSNFLQLAVLLVGIEISAVRSAWLAHRDFSLNAPDAGPPAPATRSAVRWAVLGLSLILYILLNYNMLKCSYNFVSYTAMPLPAGDTPQVTSRTPDADQIVASHMILIQPLWRTDDERSRRQAVALSGRLASEFPGTFEAPKLVADSHARLGDYLARHRRFGEAVAEYLKALKIGKGLAAKAPGYRKHLIGHCVQLARILADGPDAQGRDPAVVVALQGMAELAPQDGDIRFTLGVAHYRAGEWDAAIKALEGARELRSGNDGYNGLFLAMAHWRLGRADTARRYYSQASVSVKSRPQDERLGRLHAEAAALLGISAQPAPDGEHGAVPSPE